MSRIVTDDGILLDKATEIGDDPFAAFSEWTSEADHHSRFDPAIHVLQPPTPPTPQTRR